MNSKLLRYILKKMETKKMWKMDMKDWFVKKLLFSWDFSFSCIEYDWYDINVVIENGVYSVIF